MTSSTALDVDAHRGIIFFFSPHTFPKVRLQAATLEMNEDDITVGICILDSLSTTRIDVVVAKQIDFNL